MGVGRVQDTRVFVFLLSSRQEVVEGLLIYVARCTPSFYGWPIFFFLDKDINDGNASVIWYTEAKQVFLNAR